MITPVWNIHSNRLYFPRELAIDWVVKMPQVAHRLSRTGTLSFLRIDWQLFIESDRKGIIYVDISKKAYIFVPMQIIKQYEPTWKDFQSQPEGLAVLPLKKIVDDHKLEINQIPPSEIIPKGSVEANKIKMMFGLKPKRQT